MRFYNSLDFLLLSINYLSSIVVKCGESDYLFIDYRMNWFAPVSVYATVSRLLSIIIYI